MYSDFNNIKIVGMTTAVPENSVENMEYASVFGEEEVKKQIKVTGIKKRRCLRENQTLLDLNVITVKRLLEHKGWSGEDVDVLIYVSAYNCQAAPSTAYYLMNVIGASATCIGFDMNLGCSSFVNGLYMASCFLKDLPENAKGIVVISDSTTVGGTHEDKSVSMLSGDCATAVAIEKKTGNELKFQQCFDGSRYKCLYRQDIQHNLIMDGMSVFHFTITDVADSIKNYIKHYKIDIDECDYFVLHQAQKFIVSKVAQFSGIPKNKVLVSYDTFGNTGGPSLPCTLCANIKKISNKEQIKVFFAGYGSGLSWGMVTADLEVKDIVPVIYVE